MTIKNENYDLEIYDSYAKIDSVMQQYKNKKIYVSYSGGSDSDTLMWLLKKRGYNVPAVFFDTGLEYAATHKHIEYMRSAGFDINIVRAKVPIPKSNKDHGNPFINKYVSELLSRLQKHNFDFNNHGNFSYEDLIKIYPNCKSALKWWCNSYLSGSKFNINRFRLLKEFLIEFGLPFKVSGKCCDGAKKIPARIFAKENGVDLMMLGIRKAEGGIRSGQYKNCFIASKTHSYAMYFPLFWWSDETKKRYDNEMMIKHSDCYSIYGLARTGCAGCPFGKGFDNEIEIIKQFEPKLSVGINSIFGKSHDWTRKYKEFMKNEN